MNKDTATQAIVANLAEPQSSRDAKRNLFEAAAYDHYKERSGLPPEHQMTQEGFCRLREDGKYFFTELEACWWGFQAGFIAAALAGAKPEYVSAVDVQTR